MPGLKLIHAVKVGGDKPDEIMEVLRADIDAAASGNTEVVPAVPGRKIRVLGIKFSVASAVTVQWRSGATTELSDAEAFGANGGMSDFWGPYGWFFETAEGEALNINLGGSVQVSGHLNYILV